MNIFYTLPLVLCKIKLLLKNIVIHLKERIYIKFKQLKDN